MRRFYHQVRICQPTAGKSADIIARAEGNSANAQPGNNVLDIFAIEKGYHTIYNKYNYV